ncbi:MAG: PD40 domain-containing protein [Armatimonadetes bacterium]|nr:PD40 domain-containing protein [Armatimonadota bacterium]
MANNCGRWSPSRGAVLRKPCRCALALLVACLACLAAWQLVTAQEEPQVAPQADGSSAPPAPADAAVRRLLADPAFPSIPLDDTRILSDRTGDDGVRSVRFGCGGNYSGGALSYDTISGRLELLGLVPTPQTYGVAVLSLTELQTTAVSFARDRYPDLWDAPKQVKVRLIESTELKDGSVHFSLDAQREGVSVGEGLTVGVNVSDGRVDMVGYRRPDPAVLARLDQIMTREVAQQKARAVLVARKGTEWEEAELLTADCALEGMQRQKALIWAAVFWDAPPEKKATPTGRAATVWLDAISGEPQRIDVSEMSERQIRQWLGAIVNSEREFTVPTRSAEDAAPSWLGADRLAFLTCRPRHGRPAWRERALGVAVVDLATGMLAMVDMAWDVPVTWVSGSASTDTLLAFANRRGTYALDLRTGLWRRIDPRDRPVGPASFGPGGRTICFEAHRRHGDLDVFHADFSVSDLKMHNQTRIVRRDGPDYSPLLSYDGQVVYFAGTPPRGHTEAAIWRTSATNSGQERTPPEKLVDGFGTIRRMSLFPDGRLLVWHADGLDIVDPEAKTKEPLDLPPLHDPELPDDRPALKLRDPAVSPDGQMLAFSGYRDSGDPERGTGWYIYTCNLDGSDVKRITPLEDDPVEPYVFPETGKTAFDVAKAISEQQNQQEGE